MTKDKVASVVQWRERRSAKAEAPGSIPGRRIVVVQTFQSAPCRLENLHHNGGPIPVAVTQTAECRSSKPDAVGSIPTRCTV